MSPASNPNPVVSVVIPAFNAQAFIANAVHSAQVQTLSDIEIIVIDDVSSDDTAKIVLDLSRKDQRIRYAKMATNSGPGASRNLGLALSRGEWVALLDVDDSFHPDRLEMLTSLARIHAANIVSDNLLLHLPEEIAGQSMLSRDVLPAGKIMSFLDFIDGCYYDADTKERSTFVFMHPMISRRFLTENGVGYDASCRNGEDFLLYLDCLLAGAIWYVTPEPLYNYTVRRDSLTNVVSRQDRGRMVNKLRYLLRSQRVRADEPLSKSIWRHLGIIAPDYYLDEFRMLFADARSSSRSRLCPRIVGLPHSFPRRH